ncbi:hypothetical protein P3X46_028215 [Hevea brasiliensis]|uniref:Terpene synthase n=1 Tax=Hevea brasiliensis TaxID=3981 RepID=A0ABQ9KPJ3_HEVBR|nr:hypothetical protein P3X46_028215 [Hevea brasiliensis]
MSLPAATQRAQVRRTAQFHPTVWGDYFIKRVSDNQMASVWTEQAKILKEVRRMLTSATDHKASEKLMLLDAIQRLGISYHFEGEIEEALEKIYQEFEDDGNLCTVALRFRLLRQQGYHVSSDVFSKFKDGEGNFKEDLINDVHGLLSLYEASYLSVQGEDILDEALEFTKTHLIMANQFGSPLAGQVSHALRWPIRRGLPRKEWWIDLDFTTKLPFARDRVIECSFCALGTFSEPQYVFAREVLSKAVAMLSVMDDIYDVHGTIEELELFTKVVESWDISMKDQLPDYMKANLEAFLDFYAEIEAVTTKEGRPFCIHYAKEAVKKQVRAYITEARWFNSDYVPTLEEYISVAVISSTYPILITLSFCGMGEVASKEVFDWLFTEPKLLYAASGLARLIDDIRSHEFEQERGHVASAVECYMKQHGVSQQEAYDELYKIVITLWKDLNEELLKETADIPKPILMCILNIVRVMDVVYKDEDSYTNSKTSLKDILATFLVHPVAV